MHESDVRRIVTPMANVSHSQLGQTVEAHEPGVGYARPH